MVTNDGKALYKLMNKAVYRKTIKIKDVHLKWTSKPSYFSHKVFDNELVAMRKKKCY